MRIIKALLIVVQKLKANVKVMLVFQKVGVASKVKVTGVQKIYLPKGLSLRYIHVKYKSFTHCSSKVIANVKVMLKFFKKWAWHPRSRSQG